jgi:Flp pilus assembly protein CpaB
VNVVSEVAPSNTGTDAGLHRRRRGLAERLTLGHVAPVVLAVFAAVFMLAALRDRSATVEVPVASANIKPGAAVSAADTRLIRVHRGDGRLLAGVISPAQLQQAWVAAVAIHDGDPITRSMVVRTAAGASALGAMSLPVPANRADGGALVPGDRVDVLGPGGSGGAAYLAENLEVLAVSPTSNTGVLASTGAQYWVSVAVDRPTALRLAAALNSGTVAGTAGSLEVVRSTGEVTSTSSASSGGRG